MDNVITLERRPRRRSNKRINTMSYVNKVDNLSTFLDNYASVLSEPLKHKESSLRRELLDGFANLRASTQALGRLLWEYKRLFKQRRIWKTFINGMARHVGYDARSLYRWVRCHDEKLGIRQPRLASLCPQEHNAPEESITNRQADLLLSRLRIREAVAPFAKERKLEVLTQLIGFEAFETWGMQKPFTLFIEPAPPSILLDHTYQQALQAIE